MKWSWPISQYYPSLCPERQEENLSTADSLTKIQTEYSTTTI